MNTTSHSAMPTLQQASEFKYIVQAQPLLNEEDFDRDVYETEHLGFELKLQFEEVSYLGFSQRRFIGFRNRYEFEKKRLIVASKK